MAKNRSARSGPHLSKGQLSSGTGPPIPYDGPTFSTSTSLLLTLALGLIGIGLTAAICFTGQSVGELPYRLYGREATAVVGDRWVETDFSREVPIRSLRVTVYYFREDQQRVVSARLRGAERLKEDNLVPGAEVQVVYLPDRTDEVMPKEIAGQVGEEIAANLFRGLGIAFPGAVLLFWLIRSGRLKIE